MSEKIKHRVHDFVQNGDSTGVLSNLTALQVAEVFTRKYPDHGMSIFTIQKYVTHSRAGKIQDEFHVDYDSIVASIGDNRDEAMRGFGQVDLDPLGISGTMRDMVEIPESYTEYDAPLKLDSYGKKMGVISDIHLPVHDRPALIAAHAFLKQSGIDCLLILGDLMDSSNLSRHPQSKGLRYTWKEEIEVGRAYVKSLRVMFPDIRIVLSAGNHDQWLQRFLLRQAPQLENEYMLHERLMLKEHDIDWIHEDRLMTYGDLYLHHGHKLGIGGGRHVATRLLDKFGVNIMVGHFHRQMTDSKISLDGKVHAAWVNGCLSDMHPGYNPYGSQTHGFSIVDLHDGGLFTVKQYRIINGKVIG